MKRMPGLIREVRVAVIVLLIAVVFSTVTRAQETKIDATTPLDQLRSLSSTGNPDAMMELGERLIQGTGVTADAPEGLKWLQKAADAGRPEAWYALGMV